MKRLFLTMLCVAVPALVLLASDEWPHRPWPVEAVPGVASSFCEYREGHLHAGIDVRTYGAEGTPCVAAGSGYVSRVRASAVGYGKALYIQLESGETLVYAHLSEFSPALDDEMRAVQRRLGRYEVDFRPAPGAFPVKTGDVIAYSGSTGGVDPHLHFEIRNQQEHPMDPFAHGFALDDREAPVFESVLLIPMLPGSGPALELPVRRDTTGEWKLCAPLVLEGSYGLAVEVFDPAGPESFNLAPQSLTVTIDGALLADVALEQFSFGQDSQVDFVYEMGMVRTEKRYFTQLFRREGETLWNREFVDDGWIRVSDETPRPRRVEVTVRDRTGNQSRLVFDVRPGRDAPACAAPVESPEGLGLYCFEDLLVPATPRGREALTLAGLDEAGVVAADLPDVTPLREAPSSHEKQDPVASGTVNKSGAGDTGSAPVEAYLVALRKSQPDRVEFDDLGVAVDVGARTAYGDVLMTVRRWQGAGTVDGELERRTRPVEIGPLSLSLRNDYELHVSLPGADSSDAIYRLNEQKGTWAHYASQVVGGVVTTQAKRPGVYAVMRDTIPPAVSPPRIAWRKSYATGERHPEIRVDVDDDGSGVDDSRTEVFLGEEPLIARWDGRSKKLFVDLRDVSIMGPRAITVVAYDRLGNRFQLDATIDIPQQTDKRKTPRGSSEDAE